MAITNYTELQAAVTNWLDRSDLSARVPEFISLTEPKIRRLLRDSVARATGSLTASVSSLTLPSGFKEVHSFSLDEGDYKIPLRPMSPSQLQRIARSGTGRPCAFAVIDGAAYFDVTPDAAYDYILVYLEGHTALSGGAPTNSILTNSPDIYLYGALLEAAPYLEHDQRVALWSQAFEKAIAEENVYRERAEYAVGTEQDLPVVFGGDDGF